MKFPKTIKQDVKMQLLEYIDQEFEEVRSVQVSDTRVAINHYEWQTIRIPILIVDLKEQYILQQVALDGIYPKMEYILNVIGIADALRTLPFRITTTSSLLEPKTDDYIIAQPSRAILWRYSWKYDILRVIIEGYREYMGEYDPVDHFIRIPDVTNTPILKRHLKSLKAATKDVFNPRCVSPIELQVYGYVDVTSDCITIQDDFDQFKIKFAA